MNAGRFFLTAGEHPVSGSGLGWQDRLAVEGQLGRGLLGAGIAAAIFVAGFFAGRETAPRPRGTAAPVAATADRAAPAPIPQPVDPLAQLASRALEDGARVLALPTESQQLDALAAWTSNEPPAYALVKRGPDAFVGDRIEVHGRVLEIRDAEPGSILRVATRGHEDIYWIESVSRPSDRVVERARVRVYGYLASEHTYESQAGWTISLPVIYAVGVVEERQMSAHLRRRRP